MAFLQTATGGTGSVIVTVNVQLMEFPAPSNTRYTTVVTPLLNVSSFGNSVSLKEVAPVVACVTDVSEQLSLAVGITRLSDREHWPGSIVVVWLVGQPVIVGGCVSFTVIDKVQDPVLF